MLLGPECNASIPWSRLTRVDQETKVRKENEDGAWVPSLSSFAALCVGILRLGEARAFRKYHGQVYLVRRTVGLHIAQSHYIRIGEACPV